VTPLSDGQHDQLPPHIRKGIDDELSRMRAEDAIAAAASRPAEPRWLGWVILLATLICGLGLIALFVTIGHAANFDGSRDHVVIHTPTTTYGAPPT
jgi:hypothetical protein